MAEGFRIAEAYVEVDIDQTKLAEQLAKVEFALLEIKDRSIKMGIDQEPLDVDILKVQEKMDALQRRISLTPDMDQSEVDEGLARLIAKINTTRTRLNILPDTGEVRARLMSLSAEIKAMQEQVKVEFDPEGVSSGLARMRAEFEAIRKATIKVGVDSPAISRAFADIKMKMEVLQAGTVVDIKVRDVEAKAEITELLAMLEKLQKEYNIKVDLRGVGKDLLALTAVDSMVARMTAHMKDFVNISTLPSLSGGRWWWISWAHWIIAGGSELAAVVIPAMVALASTGAVVAQGVQMAYIHMTSLWQAAEATGHYLHQTMGTALGLRSALQDAQDAANPKVYQALGAAIDIAKTHLLDMAGVGTQVIGIFDHFLAHFQYTMSAAGGGGGVMHKLLEDMVPDLVMIGQIFGNLGHAIANFAAAMPGLAGGMLLFLNAVSRVLLAISSLPPHLLMAIMVIEEIWRWGGLAATVMSRLSNAIMALGNLGLPILSRFTLIFSTALKFIPMALAGILVNLGGTIQKMTLFGSKATKVGEAVGGLGLKLVGVAEFMGGPWGMGIAAGALAIGGLIFWLSRAKTATEQWIDSTNKSIESANSLHVLLPLQDALLSGQTMLTNATRKLTYWQDQANKHQQAGYRSSYAFAILQRNAAREVDELTKANQHYDNSLKNVLQGAGYLVGFYKTSFIGALALATSAGVKLQDGIIGTGRDATIARIQIADYVQGLLAMGQPLGAIGNDMSALAVQSGLATTKVQQLNSAWDDFINNVTGGETAFSGFVLAMQGLGITGLKSTASMKGTVSSIDLLEKSSKKGKDAAKGLADSLTAAGQKGAQTFQQFNAAITGPGQQMLDWLRIAGAEGQITGKDLTTATRAIIAQMLPMAKHSKAATAELSAMAQEAGGPFTSNFKELKDWVDRGTHSMGGLHRIVDRTTIKMANMSDVAEKLGTTMQQMIVSTMDKAQLASSGLTAAVGKLTEYIKHNGTAGIEQSGVYKQVLEILTSLTGSQQTATNILKAYTDKVNAGNDAAHHAHNTLKALNDMQVEYNDSVQKGNQPQKNLIQNLIDIGKKADLGKEAIARMIHKITGIPTHVILNIEEHGVGHFTVTQALSRAGQFAGGGFQAQRTKHPGNRKGTLIPGYGGGDIWPAMLEPGEAVVPKEVVPHVAHVLKRHGVPGFQYGGIFSQTGNKGVDTGQAAVTSYHQFKSKFTKSMEDAMTAAIKREMSQMARSMMFNAGKSAYGGSMAAKSFAMAHLSDYGWGASQWPPLLALWNQESGWNPYAVNPSSGAYGIPQSLGHGHPFNLGDYANQIRWGLAYIASTYGSPAAAWAHEVAHNWYAGGTAGAMPGWGIVGERGPELVGFHGGEPVIPFIPGMMRGGRVPGYAGGTGHMAQSGAAVARAFSKVHNVTTAVNAIHELLKDIHKYFTGHKERERAHLVHRQEHHLMHAVRELQHINSRIEAGRKYRADVLSNLSGYADLSGLMVGSGYVGAGGRMLSGGAFLEYQLKQRLGNLRKFAAVLKRLGKAHVPHILIRQIVAMGPDAGLEFANEILAGGHDLIKQLGKTEDQIAAEERMVARQAAGDIYAGGKLDIAGAFRHQRRQIEHEIHHWAKVFGTEAARWFDVPRSKRPKHYQTGGTIPIGSMGIVGERGIETVHSTPYGAIVTPGDASGGVVVVQQYYGTQHPTPEQQRRMNVDLALALGIAP